MFYSLRDDLDARQQSQWPVVNGIGDILVNHFDLDTENGKNFKKQIVHWVSKEADANKEVTKFKSVPELGK